MLSLSGAGAQIMDAARHLHCEICARVQPPRDMPQVSANRPGSFNYRLSGDTFFVWDNDGRKFGIVHFIDALTDYQISDAAEFPTSKFTARLLRNQWYGVFGPPDVLITDGGREFMGVMDTVNDLFGVQHEIIPDGAKWRLGHAERHGAILKIMIMKMVQSHSLRGLDDIRMAAGAAVAAKNRLTNNGGTTPLQAVTGKETMIPASLMTQICSGKMKFVVNQEVSREETLRRAERIRQAAVESFMWIDAHQSLRKALASKSRPPRLELIREGAQVYIYDPPNNRRGLGRRIQDNVSWSGPGVVVCVERDRPVPNKVWVRLKGRLRAMPLERVRLATVEEVASGQFIKEAIEDLEKELKQGRVRAERDRGGDDGDDGDGDDGDDKDSSNGTESDDREEMADEEVEPPERQLQQRLLQDVPLGYRTAKDPASMPFQQKRDLFQKLAKGLEPPTPLQEARIRGELEAACKQARGVKKRLKGGWEIQVRPPNLGGEASGSKRLKVDVASGSKRQRENPTMLSTPTSRLKVGDTLIVSSEKNMTDYDTSWMEVGQGAVGAMVEILAQWDYNSPPNQDYLVENPNYDLASYVADVEEGNDFNLDNVYETIELHQELWGEGSTQAREAYIMERAKQQQAEEESALVGAELVTGKQRIEYYWSKLDAEWRAAYVKPIHKAYDVYIKHEAIAGVPEGQFVDPQKILPSRLTLTNKGEKDLAGAVLKARWIFGGHRDQEAGKYQTSSPTVGLIGHNLLVVIAVQKRWEVIYEDVSAAFLQGKRLEREVYVKIPTIYPPETTTPLTDFLGPECRKDIVRLTKGGFGLCESPRLWYLEYRRTLQELGGRELRLLPGFFVFNNQKGELIGMCCIHVDDTRYAGSGEAEKIWEQLHKRLRFGDKRKAVDGWTKFCGRQEVQDPTTLEMTFSMDDYCQQIPMVREREKDDMERPLTDVEAKAISSVIGQVNWAARQCRYDLSFAASHCQQLAGEKNPEALMWANRVVRRAKGSLKMIIRNLGCDLEDMVVLSISDAAYGAQPRGGSQGGLLVALASPRVLKGTGEVILLEGQSSRIQRVARSSMAAELSEAATAYEHGDYVRALMAEILIPTFTARAWKMFSSRWSHVLVLDAGDPMRWADEVARQWSSGEGDPGGRVVAMRHGRGSTASPTSYAEEAVAEERPLGFWRRSTKGGLCRNGHRFHDRRPPWRLEGLALRLRETGLLLILYNIDMIIIEDLCKRHL